MKQGDKVRIKKLPPLSEESKHFGEDTSYLDEYEGIETTILKFNGLNKDGLKCYYVDIVETDGDQLSCCEVGLELINKK